MIGGEEPTPAILQTTAGDGAPVWALDEGAGAAILVVHPGSSAASSWEAVARLLSDDFRVVRLQRRLYDPKVTIVLPHTMAVEAADVLAIAAELDRPLLVGHSSGAVAAIEAALASPTSFAAMVLYEPPLSTTAPVAGEAGKRARAALDAGGEVEAMRIHLRDIVGMPPATVEAMFAAPGSREHFARIAAAQIADNEALDALGVGIGRYAALDLPALLVEGDASPPHLRQRLAALAATLPNVRGVVTLPGQGHIAHLTAPVLLANTIRDFAHQELR